VDLLGVPSAATARERRARVAAFAGLAAASRPVPPAPASTWRRDIDERGRRVLAGFSGITET
jgi:hypothetical protein